MKRLHKIGTASALALALALGAPVTQTASAAATFIYAADGDYTHVTNNQASAHGWWNWTSANPPERKALVSIFLQKYDKNKQEWVNVGTPGQDTYGPSSGGTGRRVTAKADCNGTASTQWRSAIVATVITQPGDSFNKSGSVTTLSRTLSCG